MIFTLTVWKKNLKLQFIFLFLHILSVDEWWWMKWIDENRINLISKYLIYYFDLIIKKIHNQSKQMKCVPGLLSANLLFIHHIISWSWCWMLRLILNSLNEQVMKIKVRKHPCINPNKAKNIKKITSMKKMTRAQSKTTNMDI